MDTSSPNPKAEQPSCGGPADQICDKQNVEKHRYSSQDCTESKTKMTTFLMNDSDRDIFHQLGMLLYRNRTEPSNALIARAAVRSIPTDYNRFIDEARYLKTQDGRKIRHRRGNKIA